MCSSPVLTQPNFNKRFILQVNASAYGVGTILLQEGDPTTFTPSLKQWTKPALHPIAYYSATFTATERNYDIYKQELLAIMKALVHWRLYLGWTKVPFIIWTDHANLQYWKLPRNLNQQTARWHTDLQEYDFQLEYIPGKTNTVADALSQPANTNQGQQDNKDITILPQQICVLHTPKGQVIIPNVKEVKRVIVSKAHDTPTAGHPGRDETLQKVQQNYWWIGMKKWISDYVKGCAICQQTKVQTHKRHVPTYQIPTAPHTLPFQTVAMDLITGLPNRWGFNAILMIVDHRCSRAAIFLPCTTNISGPGIAQLYLDYVYRWFSLPTKIISDWDPCFTSHFGKAITRKLGIQQNLSTAFHPQTNGLSEQKNQWIEQYLCTIITSHPEDWSYWVSIASAVHNNQINSTTNLSPNEILLGYSPCLAPSEVIRTDNEVAEKQVKQMIEAWDQAIKFINRKAGEAPPSQFAVGDQVWLEGSHLRLPHQLTKLAPKRYRPFTIMKQINPVTYQLTLPATWQIHPMFHASLLSPYIETDAHGPNYSRPPPDLIGGEEFYKVEQIWDHWCHGCSRMLQYLIKWKGSPKSNNTWEPADLVLAPDLLKQYHKHKPLSGIKANQVTLQWPQHPSWILPNNPASFAPSYELLHLPPTNSMSLSCAPVLTKTCLAPSCITAAPTSLTSMPLSIPSSVKNTTVAIIPEDHLLCQPQICHAVNPLPLLHPLHPCPFQCASHPLNRPLNTFQGTSASEQTTPSRCETSLRREQRSRSPPSTLGDSPSLPLLSRMSLLLLLTHPQTSSEPLSMDLLTPSGLGTMSTERRWKDLRPRSLCSSSRSTMMGMALPNAHQGTKKTTDIFLTSPSPSTTEQSNLPVSSNSLMMEGLQGYTARPKERRMHESLSYTLLPIMPLTSHWSRSPPGSAIASGATEPPMPFSRMLSMTSMTGDSSLTSTGTDSSTKTMHTSSRSWTSLRQSDRVSSRTVLLSRSALSAPDLQKRSNTSLFARLRAPFSQVGKGGALSSHPDSSLPRDEDISM